MMEKEKASMFALNPKVSLLSAASGLQGLCRLNYACCCLLVDQFSLRSVEKLNSGWSEFTFFRRLEKKVEF